MSKELDQASVIRTLYCFDFERTMKRIGVGLVRLAPTESGLVSGLWNYNWIGFLIVILSGVKHKLRYGGELRVWEGIAASGGCYDQNSFYTFSRQK